MHNMKLFDVINEGVYDPGIFKAIFLAGGPGSGKSFVGSDLVGIPKGGFSGMDMSFAPSGVKLVNSDPEFEYFLKKIGVDPKNLGSLTDKEFEELTEPYDSPRQKAKRVKKSKERLYTQGRLGMLIDGTGDVYSKIKKKRAELIRLGYDTYMVFINTSLEVAQQRNAQRDRVLPEKVVEKIWKDVQKNLGRFQGLFGSNFKIIDNNEKRVAKREVNDNRLFPKAFYLAIKNFMKTPIKSGFAKRWIKRELELKKKSGYVMVMTETAISEWRSIVEKQDRNADKTHLRLSIKGGGCSGFMKELNFCETDDITDLDMVTEFEDVKVIVDSKSLLFLHDATLDYHDGLMGAGFTITIPSAKNSCGCGDSFAM